MTRDDIIKAWNTQADKHNRWSDLGEDEMLEFAMRLEREACIALCKEHSEEYTTFYQHAAAGACEAMAQSIQKRGANEN